MEDIVERLKKNRPNLTESSLKTYKSSLNSLHKKCFGKKEIELKDFEDECIMEHLKDLPWNKRGTIASALVVLTDKEEYKQIIKTDKKDRKEHFTSQEKTERESENMIPFEEVQEKLDELKRTATIAYAQILASKKEASMESLQMIQNYILLALTSGIYISPRRSQDWIMKWKNYDEEKDNYVDMKKNKFVFNDYKTKKVYGTQTVDIPKELKTILLKWLKVNPYDYIFFNNSGASLSQSTLAKKLMKIFGKSISTSMLRHIYLTHKFGNVNLKDLSETASEMGTSPLVALEYVKR